MNEPTEIEKLVKRNKAVQFAMLLFMGVGVVLILFGLVYGWGWTQLVNDDHLTDPAIPNNEMENATYTWTAKELKDQATQTLWFWVLGAALVGVGYALMFAVLGQTTVHKLSCKPEGGEVKYCAQCGLKLSRLKYD